MVRVAIIIAIVLILGHAQTAVADSSSSDNNRNSGVTVDDLGRGLKSAAQNIEKEIPKMGSAVGSAFKKITEKGARTSSSQEPAKRDK